MTSSSYRHHTWTLLLVTIPGVVLLVVRIVSQQRSTSTQPIDNEPVEIDAVSVEIAENLAKCRIDDWNNVTTHRIPNEQLHREWTEMNVGNMENLRWGALRLISAYVYKSEIVVTFTSEHHYGKTVHCRYFDCNRVELPLSSFETRVFPMAAAYCARRAGARYIGLTTEHTSNSETLDMVPVTLRIEEEGAQEPSRDVAVCVGPLYGEERRWLEVVETTEHHILIGIHWFYFTVFNQIDAYTRKLLDEYERVGVGEVKVIQNEYSVMDWMFHMIQITDCFFRARHHSKWILNVDIDERLVMVRMPLRSFLRTIPEDVGEISFATNRIKRTRLLPMEASEDVRSQLLFLNYNSTSQKMFKGMKALVRPDKTEALFYHWTWRQYPGVRLMSASKRLAYIRHYRTVLSGLAAKWPVLLRFRQNRLETSFEERLTSSIIRRLHSVYFQRPIWCEEVPAVVLTHFTRDNYHCTWQRNGTRFSD